MRAYSHHVVGLAFSPDGKRLATAGGEDSDSGKGGGVKLWDLATGREVLSLGGPTDIVSHVAFTPDGRSLLCLCWLGGAFSFGFGTNQAASELVIWNASDPNATAGPAPAFNRH